MTDELGTLLRVLEQELGLRALGIAWATCAPVVAIVPAFGLRATPGPMRATMALMLGLCVAPSLWTEPQDGSYALSLAIAAAKGIPIAIAAAIPMWTATMVGGVVDTLRGSSEASPFPLVEGRPSSSGVLLSLITSLVFLGTGGPSRVAGAIARSSTAPLAAFAKTATDLVGGIEIAIATAGPVIAASMVLEIGGALMARSSNPTQIHVLLAPLRSLGVLAVFAISFERIANLLALYAQSHSTP